MHPFFDLSQILRRALELLSLDDAAADALVVVLAPDRPGRRLHPPLPLR